MSPLTTSFTEKVLSKLDKLDPARVARFVRGVVRERNFHSAIFEALAEGVVVTDPQGRVVMSNSAARELLGIPRRPRSLGQPVVDLIEDEGLRRLLAEWEGDFVDQREMVIDSPNTRDLLVTLRTIPDEEEGGVLARVIVLADVTEHRRRAREAQRVRQLSSLAVLTAGVAHEIKNPLNSMRIHGQLLQQALGQATFDREDLRSRAERSVEIVLEETQRLSRIVEQFMQAVRPVDPVPRRHSLNVILRRVLEITAPEQQEPPVEIDLDLDPSLPDLWLDDQQMTQAFLNLVRNAMEALDKPARRIAIRTRAEDDAVIATVADNGCGIAREDLERIYDPYFTKKFHGTGLGLMVVHRIITEHGGRIHLSSREDEGTEVTVLLPVTERPPRLLESSPVANGESMSHG